MGLCCGGTKNNSDREKEILKKYMESQGKQGSTSAGSQKEAAPKLNDIKINDVNDLVHDRWQYKLANGSRFEDFSKMD